MPAQSPAGSLTILRCVGRGKRATKSWRFSQGDEQPIKSAFDAGIWFRAERRHLANIVELSKLLTLLEQDPLALVIRGEPLPDIDLSQRVRRKKHADETGRSWFQDVPGGLSWVLLDLDRIGVPTAWDIVSDPDGTVQYLASLLPDCFRNVSFHWQLSSSAGVGDASSVSAHLWYWLDRPVTDAELTIWADQIDLSIDTSLFRTVQPHYTATPLFFGMRDPLARRSGLWRGLDDSVEFPQVEARQPATSNGFDEGLHPAAGFEAKLALLGDKPGNPTGRGFHRPLLSATASYVATHGAENVDTAALKDRLRGAILAAPKSPHRPLGSIERYFSDEYLGDIIASAIEHFGGFSCGASPHFTSDPLPLDQAVSRLDEVVGSWLSRALSWNGIDPPQQLGIRATAGVGKTRTLLHGLVEDPGALSRSIDIYVPQHRLADELAADLFASIRPRTAGDRQLRVQVFRGREYADQGGEPMCAKADLAAGIARAGQNVWDHLCEHRREDGKVERCEHYEACRYVAQFQDPSPAVRLLTHDHLFVGRNPRLPKPEAAVIDETFHARAVQQTSFAIDRLTAPRPWRLFGYQIDPGELADLDTIARTVRRAIEAGAHPRDHGVTADQCRLAARIEFGGIERLNISPGLPYAEQKRRFDAAKRSEALKLWRFWKVLEAELERRGPLHQIRLIRDYSSERQPEPQDRIFIYWQRELRLPAIPVLMLDADLDPIIGCEFFEGLEVVDVAVERQAVVMQVLDTACSRRRLLAWNGAPEAEQRRAANRLADIQALLDVEAAIGNRTLLVSYKPVAVQIRAPAGCAVEWFGRIRGLDAYKGFDCVIVAGREQPAVQSIEDMMRALFAGDPEPLELPGTLEDAARGYRIRNGSKRGAKVAIHPDRRAQALLEQTRERESVQAIDRLRLVRRSRPARVIVMSNVPLDITVDRLVTWKEIIPCRIEQALARGQAIPLSPAELARFFPDLWTSEDAARSEIRRRLAERGVKTLIDILIGKWPPLIRAAYRKPGQRGSATPALIRADAGDPRAALEAVVGEICTFTFFGNGAAQKEKGPEVDPKAWADIDADYHVRPATPGAVGAAVAHHPVDGLQSGRAAETGYISPITGVWVAPGDSWLDDPFYRLREQVRARIARYGWPGVPLSPGRADDRPRQVGPAAGGVGK